MLGKTQIHVCTSILVRTPIGIMHSLAPNHRNCMQPTLHLFIWHFCPKRHANEVQSKTQLSFPEIPSLCVSNCQIGCCKDRSTRAHIHTHTARIIRPVSRMCSKHITKSTYPHTSVSCSHTCSSCSASGLCLFRCPWLSKQPHPLSLSLSLFLSLSLALSPSLLFLSV